MQPHEKAFVFWALMMLNALAWAGIIEGGHLLLEAIVRAL